MTSNLTMSGELSYADALRATTEAPATVQITGRVLARSASGIAGPKGCIPILWCYCVQDTPDNPCNCDGPIIWLPEQKQPPLLRPANGHDGEVTFDVDGATRVFLDETREVNRDERSDTQLMRLRADGEFEAAEETLWLREFTEVRVDHLQSALDRIDGHSRLSEMAKKKGKGRLGLLVAAFEAGWEIGEFIDEKTGLSDKISDWLLDTFGPWK
jgi:hypothetical protein